MVSTRLALYFDLALLLLDSVEAPLSLNSSIFSFLGFLRFCLRVWRFETGFTFRGSFFVDLSSVIFCSGLVVSFADLL